MELDKLFDAAQNKRHSGADDAGAIADYQTIRDEAIATNNPLLAADCLHMIGIVTYHEAGVLQEESKIAEAHVKFAEADDTYERAIAEFQHIADTATDQAAKEARMRVGAVLRDRGIIATKQGDYEKAGEYIGKSIEVLTELGYMDHLGMTEARLALILAEKNDFLGAESLARAAIERIRPTGNWYFLSNAHRDLARVLIKAGKKQEALATIDEAEKILDANPERDTTVDHQTLQKIREEASE